MRNLKTHNHVRPGKLLALALAVAMIMSVIPGIGITASAASATDFTDAQVLALAKNNTTAVFDAARDMQTYNNDGAISDAWNGWSSETSANNFINVNGSAAAPRIQAYTNGDAAGNGISTNISTVTTPGYGSGNDYIVFSFKPEYTTTWGDIALVDSNDIYITGVRYGTENNAFNVEWGHNGWTNPFASGFTDRYSITKNGGTQTVASGSSQVDIVLRAISETQYTAAYFLDGAAEPFTIVTYNGSFDCIKSIKMSRGSGSAWNRISIQEPVIYAGNYPESYIEVTATYKFGDKVITSETKGYNSGEASGVTFDAKNIVFEGELYHADAVTLTESQDVQMTPAPRYKSDITTIKDKNDVDYDLSETSVVLNGTFDYGMAGWTSGNFNTDLSDSNGFSVVADKNNHTNVLKQGKSNGSGNATSLGTKWPVEAGKTYYFAYDTMRDTDAYHNGGIKFFKTDGSEASNMINADVCILGNVKLATGNSSFGDNDGTNDNYKFVTGKDWRRKEYMFVIPEGVGYLGMQMAWTDNTYIDNVELREATPQATPTSVTIKYVDETSKDIKESKTVTNVFAGKSYTYDYSGDGMIVSDDFTVYRVVSVEESTLEIKELSATAEENVITVVYKPIEFATAKVPGKDTTVKVGDKDYKVVDTKNYVPNPSFETVDGKYDFTGWYGGNGGKSNTNPYPEAHQTSSTDATAGNYSFGSRYGDAWNGLCTILTSFKVDPDKTYYFAYDVKYANNSTPNNGASVSLGIGEGPYGVSIDNDQKTTTNISGVGSDWTTNARIIKVDSSVATDPYIQFNAYYLGNTTNNGDMPKFLFDNFILIEVEEIIPETRVDVTATYKNAEGKTVYTATGEYDTAKGENDITFPEKYVYFEGEVYYLPETTLTESEDVTVSAYRYRSHENGEEEPFMVGDQFYKYIGDSVVVNGDFKTGTVDGWTNPSNTKLTDGTILNDSERGNYLSITTNNAAATRSIGTVWNVEVGKTYYLSFWVGGKKPAAGNNQKLYNRVLNTAQGNSYDVNTQPNNNVDLVAFGTEMIDGQWNHFEKVFEAKEDKVVFVSRWAAGPMWFAGVELVPVEETEPEAKVTGVQAIPDITVIAGNDPIFPSKVTLLTDLDGYTITADVTWDKDAADAEFDAATAQPITVTGTVEEYDDVKPSFKVTVLPRTFTMPDQESYNNGGGPGNVVYLPVSLYDEFSMEFDLYVNAIKDSSVQIGKDGAIFGAGQIGLGTNGNFIPTSGNGSGGGNTGTAITTVEAGNTYRIFLTVNPKNNSYTATLTKADGSVYTTGGERKFRTNADYINTITMITNGGGVDGDLKITNVKFYAEGVELNDYAIVYVGVPADVVEEAGVDTSVKTTNTTDLGYNGEKVFPNLVAPYFPGYVFKSKTVSGTTITLTYEPTDSSATFFKDATDNNAPFISLNMLGAHDAFTKNVGTMTDAAAVSRGEDGASLATSFVNRTKTQDMSILEMLNYGVRYFDIRLSRSDSDTLTKNKANSTNGVFYTTHNALSDEFGPVAVTIAQWAKEHPGEVIILDFQEIWDATSAGKTESGDLHGSTAKTWSDLSTLLRNSGIYEFVTIGNSDVSGHTYGSLTNNGEKANIVLVGRAVSNGANNFIVRGPANADGSSGYVYSNYKSSSIFDDTTIGSSYNAKYIHWQVNNCAKTGKHYIASLVRVMQGQSEGSNLLNQASDDNRDLYSGLQSNPYWLTALPIIMVNGIGKNTDGILDLLKNCNVAQDVTVNLSVGGTTTTKAMVGTLYTGKGSLLSGGDYGYYVTSETPTDTNGKKTLNDDQVIPVPYNGSIYLDVAALPSVYTMSKNEQVANSYNLAYIDGGSLDHFSAYNWAKVGALSDNRRVGVSVLEAEAKADYYTYTLDATQLRDCRYDNPDYPIDFYVMSYEDYQALDISDFAAVAAKFTGENRVATYTGTQKDNNTPTPVSIELDAAKLKAAIGVSGKVVIFGDSHGGLYRLDKDMKITATADLIGTITPELAATQDDGLGIEFTVDFSKAKDIEDLKFSVTVEFLTAEGKWEEAKDKENGTGAFTMTVNDLVEGKAKVLVVPGNSNLPYSIVARAGKDVTTNEAADAYKYSSATTLYEEVINNIVKSEYSEETSFNGKRLAKANEVIANGGLASVDTFAKDDVRSKIMNFDGNATVSIKPDFAKLGIGFLCVGKKLYIGNDGTTFAEAGSDTIVYTSITDNKDGTYTLSADGVEGAALAEMVIYLEDVEFLFESLTETAADENVSGELELVEEV